MKEAKEVKTMLAEEYREAEAAAIRAEGGALIARKMRLYGQNMRQVGPRTWPAKLKGSS